MARNRYVKDYRLIERFDEKGRLRTDYEYLGAPYFFCDPARAAGAKKRAVLLLLLGILCFLLALLPVSAGMHTFYVSVPFIFSALPLGLLADLELSVFPQKEPLEHRHADKLANRLPPAALAAAILAGIALLGEGVMLLLGKSAPVPGDLLFSLCAAGVAACGICLFSLRGGLAAEARTEEEH